MCPKGTDEGCVMGCFLEMGQAIWGLLEGDVEAMRVSMRKGKGDELSHHLVKKFVCDSG